MKIALVHDYLREYGGAERVVETLHEIWPQAPLYTAFVDWPSFAQAPAGKLDLFRSMDIRTSWVQKFPLIKKYISPLRFLAPLIWNSFDLSGYDVVISSSGWFMCRGVKTKNIPNSNYQIPNNIQYSKSNKQKNFEKGTVHICYIHHPPRNLYGYATGSDWQKYRLVRWYAAIVNFFLRHYDFETAQKVDYFISNSYETKRRVWKFYRRESEVIYPPIQVNPKSENLNPKQFKNSKVLNSKQYYLSVGRLGWAKRVDLAIRACNELKLPLKVVGVGKEMESLKSIAGPTIEFEGGVSDEKLAGLYAGAKALIFCAMDEDFGMVPVEAMACGIPVIGLAQGGVKETVIDSSAGSGQATGILFNQPEAEDLKMALQKFENSSGEWKEKISKNCLKQAQNFSKTRFKKEIVDFVNSHHNSKNPLV